jgi:hypothetical protein
VPLENIRNFDTATEAVEFATSDHGKDMKNYNLERPSELPYDRDEVEGLLRSAGYKKYQRIGFDFKFNRPPGHAEGWIRISRPHPYAVDLLKDFASRPLSPVDPRLLDYHREHNGPIAELIKCTLLTFELRPRDLLIYATMFSGLGFGGRPITQEAVIFALLKYSSQYLAPLKFETTGSGQYRVDQGHLADAENPHNFEHLHVYHKVKNYHTTLRLASV